MNVWVEIGSTSLAIQVMRQASLNLLSAKLICWFKKLSCAHDETIFMTSINPGDDPTGENGCATVKIRYFYTHYIITDTIAQALEKLVL